MLPKPLAISLSVVAGALIAVQSRVNGALGLELENGVVAALISFGIGTILISAVLFSLKPQRHKLLEMLKALTRGRLPLWLFFGGFAGGFFVMMQGLVAPTLGITLFTLAIVSGQALSALMLDSFGLIGMTKRVLSLARLVGALLALIGVVLFAGLGFEVISPLAVLPFLAGFGTGFQQAINGRLAKQTESVLLSTYVNFVAGTLIILVTLLLVQGIPVTQSLPTNPWLYLGGVVGGAFIFLQVLVVRQIGVLALGLSLLAGQVVAALILDLLLPISAINFAPLNFLGVLLVVTGASLVVIRR
ncbi:MAG: DMT family transporter [Micrococcales bacterium]|nr:DMT family transporter [Micrococcales bacterium]